MMGERSISRKVGILDQLYGNHVILCHFYVLMTNIYLGPLLHYVNRNLLFIVVYCQEKRFLFSSDMT